MSRTREEHIQFSKDRAMEYVEKGNLVDAYASMVSDLNKHPETKDHPAIQLGLSLMMSGHLSTKDQVREFIDGFN